MAGIPISAQQAVRVALVFVVMMVGFSVLSNFHGVAGQELVGNWCRRCSWPGSTAFVRTALGVLRDSGAVIEIKGVKLDFSKSAVSGCEWSVLTSRIIPAYR